MIRKLLNMDRTAWKPLQRGRQHTPDEVRRTSFLTVRHKHNVVLIPVHSGIFSHGAQFSDDQMVQAPSSELVHRRNLISGAKWPQGIYLKSTFFVCAISGSSALTPPLKSKFLLFCELNTDELVLKSQFILSRVNRWREIRIWHFYQPVITGSTGYHFRSPKIAN